MSKQQIPRGIIIDLKILDQTLLYIMYSLKACQFLIGRMMDLNELGNIYRTAGEHSVYIKISN